MRSNYRDALFDRMGSAGANHAALKGDVSMNICVAADADINPLI
jgi:hypothetical protein